MSDQQRDAAGAPPSSDDASRRAAAGQPNDVGAQRGATRDGSSEGATSNESAPSRPRGQTEDPDTTL